MSLENNQQRSPMDSYKAEDFDAKGSPRRNHEMTDGTMFFGSDEEHTQELLARREEAKN